MLTHLGDTGANWRNVAKIAKGGFFNLARKRITVALSLRPSSQESNAGCVLTVIMILL